MSTELQKSLWRILDGGPEGPIVTDKEIQKAIGEIEQAFKDAGWIKPGEYYAEVHGPIKIEGPIKPVTPEEFVVPRMTGQEWFDRFEAEVNRTVAEADPQPSNDVAKRLQLTQQGCLEAAKRVAGLQS